MSAICFSKSAVLLSASFTLFSRAIASSCKAVILACNDLTSSPLAFAAISPAESLTTSFGPVEPASDLSSAELILPPADCVLASESDGADSATIPANLLRYAFQLAVCTLISLDASLREIEFNVSCDGWRKIWPTLRRLILLP